eukprot:TRINITY_DN148_c1_g1_i1.p1 TRINITY_DN148_c1_g1~~TRINITY_DN148_c1_g1_i1.p1  ORF type:complete len:491 (+),score=134.24 TRINITY_DN148_c1_g1_i1:120-1592(+)
MSCFEGCLRGCAAIGGAPAKDGGKAKVAGSCGLGRANFIADNPGRIEQFYKLDRKKLGEGSFGSVCKATEKNSTKSFAVKSIPKKRVDKPEKLKQEIALMKIMDHPHIIRLFETFQDAQNVYLVMEVCTGGELFDRIVEVGRFSEKQAAVLMRQIIGAVFYMHQSHVCHRDLKPENFLLTNKNSIESSTLKIIDFGLSCSFKDGDFLTTKAGTPYYVSPQVLAGKYTKACDNWSCGTIMYVLLCGYPPFYGDSDGQILQKVRLGNYSFAARDWKNVSEDAKNLIRHLLKMNEMARMTAEGAVNDVWFTKWAPQSHDVPLHEEFIANLKSFGSKNKLKRAALQIIAASLDDAQIKELKEVFQSLDANGDGLLTYAEMHDGLRQRLPSNFAQMVESIDADGSGAIDYTEFLAAALDQRHYVERDACWAAFRSFDRDGSGSIDRAELRMVVAHDDVKALATEEMLNDILQRVDNNHDGQISFEEFMEMMRSDK